MKHSRERHFLLTLLLFISSASLFGQKFEPKKRLLDPDTTITSKIMGKDYQLYISFPKGYSTKDTTKYPVLFVLDGQGSFPVFKSVRESMDIDKELDSLIIVGIVEIPPKQTPFHRVKLTPFFRAKVTPLFRVKLTPVLAT